MHEAAPESRLPPPQRLADLMRPAEATAAFERWEGFIALRSGATSQACDRLRLIRPGKAQGWFHHVHLQTAEIPPLGVLVLDDVVLSGPGMLCRHDRLLTDGTEPYEVAQQIAVNLDAPSSPTVVVLDPVLLVVGPGHGMWGHWLLDILPRLALAREALGAMFDRCILPLPQDTPGWADALLARLFGIPRERVLRYHPAHEALLCRRALLPSHAHASYHLHPYLRSFYAGLTDGRATPDGPTRIFVSRMAYTAAHPHAAHQFAQTEALEAAARKRGFTVVAPELLDFDAQLDLFAGAQIVAGFCGSGMHNTLFCRPGTVVGQIGMPNSRQSRIAGLCAQPLVYLLPEAPAEDAEPGAPMQVAKRGISDFFEAVTSDPAVW